MTSRPSDWRAAADEVERLLGVRRRSLSISRRIEHQGHAPILVVRGQVAIDGLPDQVMGYRVEVERPDRPKVKRGLL